MPQAPPSEIQDQPASALYYPISDTKMTRGEGIYLFDEDGNAYIDCAAGTFNLSLGYSHPVILQAMRDQLDNLIHVTSSFRTGVIEGFVERLAAAAPANITRVHPKVSGGSSANEGAIKMAQRATGKQEIVTLFRSHLGQTIATASMSGNAFRSGPIPFPQAGVIKVPDPYCRRCFYSQNGPGQCAMQCVERIADFIEYASAGRVAALILEPISGNGGNIVPPPGYLTRLREFCDQNDIVLIFDEIQTGIGRTGKMFAAQHFGVEPDAITTAKGLGGSGAQVAAILTNERLSGLPSNDHSFTYGSNVLALAAASATLDIVSRPAFLENVTKVGNYFLARLKDMASRYPLITDVRGVGLMIGFEIGDPENAADVALANHLASAAMSHGLIIRTSRYGFGNVLKIRPPLIMTLDEADDVCDRLDAMLLEERP
ncbi:MAG: aspartate aminotransferase family protein [Propionibacteriaceae bacterium]|jgi:4-aminobutyrate aminotransferase|nr:aspartate aminotransferase family protein [Propionibacteriaceae bacterium]